MMNESNKSHLLDGLILGGLLGSALGILFAPFAGEKTREKIRGKMKELDMDGLCEKLGEAFEEGKKEAEKVSKELEE